MSETALHSRADRADIHDMERLVIPHLAELAALTLACIGAILVWRKTERPSWILVSLATLFLYAAAVYRALADLSLLPLRDPWALFADIAVAVLPPLLLGVGFIAFLVERHGRG
ncbi:hypothetical protein [Spirochaeta thermophila]|uniref:Uncharacterized protein n=1 Tax=Winmispira thermophila (strain ATCC 49972 / DSM 6192 / RI 19.B1) TaxID=665571 RepID=E0RR73_WINT6|nr:hypothetical protein [Spirochaeta thermophila]ADN03050.1 hypothetical protein STHERM_c21190 [Spirochaeta thermophila DSM 6192]